MKKNEIKSILIKKLSDFSKGKLPNIDVILPVRYERYFLTHEQIPVPRLVYFLFIEVLKYPLGHRGDKTHWSIPFKYKKMDCSISLQKFGTRLFLDKKNDKFADEIIEKINSALSFLEQHLLEQIAKQQIKKGNITILNRFYELDRIYSFFREKARDEFEKNKEKPSDIIKTMFGITSMPSSEGGYYLLAMLDAYFSRLENILVFLLPFINFSPKSESIVEFIGLTWGDKYKRIFDLSKNKEAQQYYDRLRILKDKLTNTYSHGGFEKKGASLYVHLPSGGVVPATMTAVKKSSHFNFAPGQNATYKDSCEILDKFDKWLANTSMVEAMYYIKSGLNLAFDQKSLKEIKELKKNEKKFKEWIEHKSYLRDIYTNADY